LREIDLHFAARPPSRPTDAQDEDFDQEPELAASTAIWRPDQSLEAAQMVDFIDFGLAGGGTCTSLQRFGGFHSTFRVGSGGLRPGSRLFSLLWAGRELRIACLVATGPFFKNTSPDLWPNTPHFGLTHNSPWF
jgi:hypothetical protein